MSIMKKETHMRLVAFILGIILTITLSVIDTSQGGVYVAGSGLIICCAAAAFVMAFAPWNRPR